MENMEDCPQCGKCIVPDVQDTYAGELLICPECRKLIRRA